MTISAAWAAAGTAPARANKAGCDGFGGSCNAHGACCDDHDQVIGWACPDGCRSVTSVIKPHLPPLSHNPCNDPNDPRWQGHDYAACHGAHRDVGACVTACADTDGDGEHDGADTDGDGVPDVECPDEPSECCDEEEPEKDYCDYPEACYDPAAREPIYDPCECDRRDIETDLECDCEHPGEQGEGEACNAFCGCGDGLTCEDGACVADDDDDEPGCGGVSYGGCTYGAGGVYGYGAGDRAMAAGAGCSASPGDALAGVLVLAGLLLIGRARR